MDTAGVVGVGAMGSVIVERFVAAGVRTLAFLPPIERLIQELGSDVPITKLLIHSAKQSGEAPSAPADRRLSCPPAGGLALFPSLSVWVGPYKGTQDGNHPGGRG